MVISKNSYRCIKNISNLPSFYFLIQLFFIFSNLIPKALCGPDNKCYILALEGGGDKGAYQAGAISGLVDNLPTNMTQYDVVTGISVGSLNGAGFSIFEIGAEKEAADFLLSIWRTINGKSSVFQNWMFGPLEGLLFKTGIYDTTPLQTLLQKIIQENSIKRKLIVGSTNIETGAYHTWDEKDFIDNPDEFVSAIMASSAFPVIFPNIKKDNTSWMDGGVQVSIDIFSGINKCLDMGYSLDRIIIDALLCSAAQKLPKVDPSKMHPVMVLIRVLEIYGYNNSMKEMKDILYDFPKVNFRFIIAPSQKLPSGKIPLTFSPQEIEKMINIGIEDAKNAINYGENGNFQEFIQEYRKKRRNRIGVKNMKLLE